MIGQIQSNGNIEINQINRNVIYKDLKYRKVTFKEELENQRKS